MIVIADDITGAAEIAGIAHRYGQPTRLVIGIENLLQLTATDCEIIVVATDTRSMTETEAVEELKKARAFLQHQHRKTSGQILFKKTDSALRGHVVPELTTLMDATSYSRAVYLPANPSKGRIIRKGTYYIANTTEKGKHQQETPIAETAFSYDPEFPARTSSLAERFPDAANQHILMPDAVTSGDICRVVEQYDDGNTLFAGAADLFTACLKRQKRSCAMNAATGTLEKESSSTSSKPHAARRVLILCGSTQSKALDIGIDTYAMPLALYDCHAESPEYPSLLRGWTSEILSTYQKTRSAILTFGTHTHRTGKESAVFLRETMTKVAATLIHASLPDELIIEGGATAFCLLSQLGWRDFNIVNEIAPGVVSMRTSNGILVTMKPGSYDWGGLF